MSVGANMARHFLMVTKVQQNNDFSAFLLDKMAFLT